MLELLAVTEEEEEEEEVKVPRLHILAPVDYSGLPPPPARLPGCALISCWNRQMQTHTHAHIYSIHTLQSHQLAQAVFNVPVCEVCPCGAWISSFPPAASSFPSFFSPSLSLLPGL